MPYVTFRPRPGFHKDESEYAVKGGWVDGDKIRFRMGLPEKHKGWQKELQTQFAGVNRGGHTWADLDGRVHTALGTTEKLYVYIDGGLINITPFRRSSHAPLSETALTDPFSTTDGSAVVEVAHSGHGVLEGDTVIFDSSASVGGITVEGEYTVTSVVDSNNFTITHSSAATSTVAGGGGTVQFDYEISPGNANQAIGFGYGIGTYGTGTYGTPRESAVTIQLSLRTWTMDNFGEDLVACPRGGAIYYWDKSSPGHDNRAIQLSNAPTQNEGILVTAEAIIVALGADGDPLSMKWCDIRQPTVWTPAADNSAGDKVVSGGSTLLVGERARDGVNIVCTDAEAFRMPFVPTDTVYEVRKIGSQAGAISQQCMTENDGVVYWMGHNRFYMYAGGVVEIPNQEMIRDFVFENLNRNQAETVAAGQVVLEHYIYWFYPHGSGQEEPNRYVAVCTEDWTWITGTMARTWWLDDPLTMGPLATSPDRYLYRQEIGHDDDGAAMYAWLKSAPQDIQDGRYLMDIMGVIPDFKIDLHSDDPHELGPIDMTFFTKEYPNEEEREGQTVRIYDNSPIEDFRESGRQAAVKFESNALGAHFRFGLLRFEVQPSGERR